MVLSLLGALLVDGEQKEEETLLIGHSKHLDIAFRLQKILAIL